MTDDELLERYKSIAEFMSLCFSRDVEVVVHDVRKSLKHTLVGIYNGHVSGRSPGAPLTKLATRFLKEKVYSEKEHICNYEGVTINGVAVRASTFFIRNEADEVIGCLCVNVDVSGYRNAAAVLNELVRFGLDQNSLPERTQRYLEDFPHKVTDTMAQIITQYCAQKHKRSDSLTPEDKYEIIGRLEKAGLFGFKGSIGDVAAHLKLSEPTIYRYLKKIRKEQ